MVLCGAIAVYNDETLPPGPTNYLQLIFKRARMEGFIVLDYLARFPEAISDLAKWVGEGRIQHKVDIVEGLENTPEAINRLFTGANTGKLLVKVSD